jgi:hypothetical protein
MPCETLLLVLTSILELSKSVSVDVLDLLPHRSFRQDGIGRRFLLRAWSCFTSHFFDFYPIHESGEDNEYKMGCVKLSNLALEMRRITLQPNLQLQVGAKRFRHQSGPSRIRTCNYFRPLPSFMTACR